MRKRRISYKALFSSSSSENDDDTENPDLQVPGLPKFSMGDSAKWEERVKKLRLTEDFENTSADSPYVKPDLQGDVQRILNRSYDSQDFVKKQRLSHPRERPLINKKRKSVPKYYHKDPATILAQFTKMEPPKQLSPDKSSSPKSSVVAASTTSSKNFLASAVAKNVFHSTPINSINVTEIADSCKITPIGLRSGKQIFATPQTAVQKISLEKTTEKDVSAFRDISEVTEPGNKSLWDFKRKSINNWINEADKNQAHWSPVNIDDDLIIVNPVERAENKIDFHQEMSKNKLNTLKTTSKPHTRNQGTVKGKKTSDNNQESSLNSEKNETITEMRSIPRPIVDSFETPSRSTVPLPKRSICLDEPNLLNDSVPSKKTKKHISTNSSGNSTVNIADVTQMNVEPGNLEKTSEKIGDQPSSNKITKEEYRKQLSEELKRLGRPERIVVTNSNFIDKEKLGRCALIWGNKNLTQDELEFLHKKFNEEALKFVNDLCASADHPGGVFTYKELQAALVKEGLIEKTAAEPYRTMFQTWTTKQQVEAKRIGLMPLSKSDDPSLFQIRNLLFPYD